MHQSRNPALWTTTRGLLSCLLATILALPLPGQNTTSDATHDIIVAREQVTDRARDIKAKFKETDPEWLEARNRYRKAFAQFSAYTAIVKDAIRKGKTNDLARSAGYKKAVDEASTAAKAFIDYAESKTTGPTRGVFLIGVLLAQAVNLYSKYREVQADKRNSEAEAFEKDVKWPRWEEIK